MRDPLRPITAPRIAEARVTVPKAVHKRRPGCLNTCDAISTPQANIGRANPMFQNSEEEGCVAEMNPETIEAIQQIISINVIVPALEANQATPIVKKTAATPSNKLTKNKI